MWPLLLSDVGITMVALVLQSATTKRTPPSQAGTAHHFACGQFGQDCERDAPPPSTLSSRSSNSGQTALHEAVTHNDVTCTLLAEALLYHVRQWT